MPLTQAEIVAFLDNDFTETIMDDDRKVDVSKLSDMSEQEASDWRHKYYALQPFELKNASPYAAVKHSIRKWEGVAWAVENDFKPPIKVDSSTCALCEKYLDDNYDTCRLCPLAISRGDVRCDDARKDEGKSPYQVWDEKKDPAPMLAALKEITQAHIDETCRRAAGTGFRIISEDEADDPSIGCQGKGD